MTGVVVRPTRARAAGVRALVFVAAFGAVGAGARADTASSATRVHVDDAAVERAMRDELARSTSQLHLGDEPKPYYLAYTISDVDQAAISATFGALTSDTDFRARVLRTDVRVGDPAFDNSNFEGGSGHVESLPIEDDYDALRRELWLRTDEGYKQAVETLARKRSAESGQAKGETDDAVGDFSSEPPARLTLPRATEDVAEQAAALRERVVHLSALMRDYPAIQGSRVSATFSIARRRMITSEGTWIDDSRRVTRIDVTADTQAGDGMRLRSFVPFTASTPGGLPPLADMEKAVRAMAAELTAMRTAPVAHNGSAVVLFEGMAAGPDRQAPAGRAVDRHAAAQDRLGRERRAGAIERAREQAGPQGRVGVSVGQRRSAAGAGARPPSALRRLPRRRRGGAGAAGGGDREGDPQGAADVAHAEPGDRALERSRARAALRGAPRPRRQPHRDLGGAGAGAQAAAGAHGEDREGGRARDLRRAAARGFDGRRRRRRRHAVAVQLRYGRWSRRAAPVRPLVVYRVKDGQEQLVRGLTLEGLLPRSLKEIIAVGKEATVYNFVDSGGGGTGIPSSIVTPALLFSDVDIRRVKGKNRKPPLYPRPAAATTTASASGASRPRE